MGLRYAAFDTAGQLRRDEFVDSIVCDCCPNAAAVTASGPVIAYRDRMAREGMRPEDLGAETATARDVHVRRLENGIWGKAVRVHADNWITNACPVNGPALDASGHQLVVAWWTAADDQPRVQLAFSEDAGDRFGAPIRIDQGAADGQVTVALMADSRGAVVGWQERGHAWARLVSADGRATAPVSLGESPRRSRLPRWVARGHGVIAGWTREERGRLSAVFTEILVQ
jgi:hypothetical protein